MVCFSDTISRTTDINYGDQNTYICPYPCVPMLCACSQPVVHLQSQVLNKMLFLHVADGY